MNIRELKKALKKAKIPTEFYNLNGKGRDDERICLIEEDEKWVVYYSERGVRTTERFFETEEAACKYVFETLMD